VILSTESTRLHNPHGCGEALNVTASRHASGAVLVTIELSGISIVTHMTQESAIDFANSLLTVAEVCEAGDHVLGQGAEYVDDRCATDRGTEGGVGYRGCAKCIEHVRRESEAAE
jgi:hypothetical protein